MEATAQLIIGLLMAAAVGLLSWKLELLTPGGALSATVIGTVIFGIGGFICAVPLLVFFFTSSVIPRITSVNPTYSTFEKAGARDGWQVFANGGVGAVLVLMQLWVRNDSMYLAYLGSIAAATSDTWATEMGVVAKGSTRSIAGFRPVPPGTSGGISAAGSFAAVAGAASIALSGWLSSGVSGWKSLCIVAGAGVAGSVVDSAIGGTIQRQYRCRVCGGLVERTTHCGVPTEFSRGLRQVSNDAVNLLCTSSGASMALLLSGLRAL